MSHFTPEGIRNYMVDNFAAERMALVGVNVAHSELTKWAMRALAEYNSIPTKPRTDPKASYTGGECRMDANTPLCHLALGFESCAWGSADVPKLAVLQAILGNGSVVPVAIG